MAQNSFYKIYGYLEFFPIETGFVTPVFIQNEKLYIEVISDNVIKEFRVLPMEYESALIQYNTLAKPEISLMEVDKCWYAFKYFQVVYFGTDKTLVNILENLVGKDWQNDSEKQIAYDFIFEFKFDISPVKSNSRISIVIVDDQTLIRETWTYLLNRENDLDVIAETGDGKKAIEIIKAKKPQIVLLDIQMSPLNGFDVMKIIRRVSPTTKVIVVSLHSQPYYVERMMRLGACGYVTKNSPRKEMIHAIYEVFSGSIYICSGIKQILLEKNKSNDEESNGLNLLTEREIEIINLILKGLSSKDIAIKLAISIKTVSTHRCNIFKKLKIENTASLIKYIHSK